MIPLTLNMNLYVKVKLQEVVFHLLTFDLFLCVRVYLQIGNLQFFIET